MTDHARWEDLAAAYVLSALADRERAGFEAHLDRCDLCAEQVASLRVAADALPGSVAQHAPPPELKDRIMAVVRSEAELLRAAGPEADRAPVRRERRRRWGRLPRPAPAFAAAVLLLAGGVAGWALRAGEGAPQRTVVASVAAPGASARLIVRDDHSTLETRRLPAPGRGRVYQVWLKHRGVAAPEPTDALFTVNRHGSASVDVPGRLADVEAVLVTAEPEGGSPAPTSAPVIAAAPA